MLLKRRPSEALDADAGAGADDNDGTLPAQPHCLQGRDGIEATDSVSWWLQGLPLAHDWPAADDDNADNHVNSSQCCCDSAKRRQLRRQRRLSSCNAVRHRSPHPHPHRESSKNNKVMPKSIADDVDSVASSSRLTILSSRPILPATPPSTRRGRSTSPSRLRASLERSQPSIKFFAPSATKIPGPVVQLKTLLSTHRVGYIPLHLKENLRATISADAFDDIEQSAFGDGVTPSESERLWAQVHDILVQAELCHRLQMDENEWVDICRSIFRAAGITTSCSMLKVISVQTQQISPAYLPTHLNANISFSKRTDLAIAFASHHPTIQQCLDEYLNMQPEASISHLSGTYTSMIPLLCGVEVKTASGDAGEALTQLGIWNAAALMKQSLLLGESAQDESTSTTAIVEPLLPFLGWTVVGHTWSFYVSWKAATEAGDVTILGPWSILSAGTDSYEQIFKLISLIKMSVRWLEGEVWDWWKSRILTRGGGVDTPRGMYSPRLLVLKQVLRESAPSVSPSESPINVPPSAPPLNVPPLSAATDVLCSSA